MDLDDLKKKISKSTCCVVASAPCYPFGVVDPIEEIAAIAGKKNIPVHVDSAIGGFVLTFLEKLGKKIPLFDFRIPNV